MTCVAKPDNYEDLLANWSVKAEQDRADFLDWLYEFYQRTDGLYTGLYQRFINDLADGLLHDLYSNHPEIFETLKTRLKLS